jgi:hypothetical protein
MTDEPAFIEPHFVPGQFATDVMLHQHGHDMHLIFVEERATGVGKETRRVVVSRMTIPMTGVVSLWKRLSVLARDYEKVVQPTQITATN